MSAYDPLQTNCRLWNDPDSILNESLAAAVMMHQDLVYLDNWKAVIRRDLDKIKGKVRIIGGGGVIDGPMYTGFIGPGMLTGAVLGLSSNTSSLPTDDTIYQVIHHCIKNDEQTGILLLVHDCAEYYLNFMQAKKKIESEKIPIKMILVRDEVSSNLSQKVMSSPQSPSGLLMIYKIAGAMAEEGKTLDEIYQFCNEIVKNGSIFSIGVYIVETMNEPVKIEITRGDRLTDHSTKRFSSSNSSTRIIVENIINESIGGSHCTKFPQGSKLALFLDHFGKFTELESNIVIKELTKQFNQFQLTAQLIFSGSFRTSLELNGFHLSILNLSSNKNLLRYLQLPTLAYYWPKTNCLKKIDSVRKNSCSSDEDVIISDKESSTSAASAKLFSEINICLKAIEYACEALIACAKNIDMLDKPSIPAQDKRCGTRLAAAAESIKASIIEKEFEGLNLADIIFRVSVIFEQDEEDPQAQMYADFFNSMYQEINDSKDKDNKEDLDVKDWMYAFDQAIEAISKVAKKTRLEDVLLIAREAFDDAYFEAGLNPIDAVGEAVLFAQQQTSRIAAPISGKIPEKYRNDKDCGFTELAGAYAVGVWMRGAYEGMKAVYRSHYKSRDNKRPHQDDSDDDIASPSPKTAKSSNDDSSSS